MTRFAIIESGLVSNVVESEEDYATKMGWIPAGDSGIGDLWDGEKFVPTIQPLQASKDKKKTLSPNIAGKRKPAELP